MHVGVRFWFKADDTDESVRRPRRNDRDEFVPKTYG
jgi:hypothetical protein